MKLTLEEISIRCGKSLSTLRAMIRAGRFPKADFRKGKRMYWSEGAVAETLAGLDSYQSLNLDRREISSR
jgi:hypothetical protein